MSFRVKITIIMTVLVAFMFSAGGTVLIHRTYMNSLTSEEKESADKMSLLIGALKMQLMSDTGTNYDISISKKLRRLKAYQASSDAFLVFNKYDELVYGSLKNNNIDFDIEDVKNILDGSDKKNELTSSDKIYVLYINGVDGMKYMISIYRMVVDEEPYTKTITENRSEQLSFFRKVFLILLCFTALVSYMTSSYIVWPLSRLTRATRKVAEGDLSTRTHIRSDDEIGELSVHFDRMTEKLEENVNALEEAAEEKDRFMGAFTHELKTPMTSIIGYAELLRTQELEEEDREDALNYIYSEAKRLENMALKLLQIFVSGKEDISLKVVDPKDMVEDIVTHLTPTLEAQNIKIICRTTEGKAKLEPDLIRTLILNIIDNARKAMDKKGRIRVDQKFTEENDGVIFIITDNGKGMPPEAIKHITEAFYRVDKARSRQQGGAGLGLALVKKIVDS